ncbi:MAG: Fic family protein [Sphaerochaeta sp.]|nr:Fic family protein [Sphaerochaeta sp.]
MYIYEHPEWPAFSWDLERIFIPFSNAVHLHGKLLGLMETLTTEAQAESDLLIQTESIIASSAIEGAVLDRRTVRSSLARHLSSLPYVRDPTVDHRAERAVSMNLEATVHYDRPLTRERLLMWHRTLFDGSSIKGGSFRSDVRGRMQVVSYNAGPTPLIHFEAPKASTLDHEMDRFLSWVNREKGEHPFITAAIAHLWFLTLHPFEDGNGRIGRAVVDYLLARSERSQLRFYSPSSAINREKSSYYRALEATQKGSLDITAWILWFLNCLERSFCSAQETVASVLRRERFYRQAATLPLSKNQLALLARYLDDFTGTLTSSKYATICKVSQDTATRDLKDLCAKGLFTQVGAGRSTHYVLASEE